MVYDMCSFCRWSSENFRSDFYIFESSQGLEIMISESYCVYSPEVEKALDYLNERYDEAIRDKDKDAYDALWIAIHAVENRHMSRDPSPLNHPEAGTSKIFPLDEIELAIDYLIRLQSEGLRLPKGVIEALREEYGTSN